jgi:hypothetical protein
MCQVKDEKEKEDLFIQVDRLEEGPIVDLIMTKSLNEKETHLSNFFIFRGWCLII